MPRFTNEQRTAHTTFILGTLVPDLRDAGQMSIADDLEQSAHMINEQAAQLETKRSTPAAGIDVAFPDCNCTYNSITELCNTVDELANVLTDPDHPNYTVLRARFKRLLPINRALTVLAEAEQAGTIKLGASW